jgi:adenosylhomocysteine nucleosidase
VPERRGPQRSAARRVAILAPMVAELGPLLRPLALRRTASRHLATWSGGFGRVEVVAAITGIGTRAAAGAAERVLDLAPADHLLVVGIAGGIGATVAIGDLVVPERVLDLASGTERRPAPLGAVPSRGLLVTSDTLGLEPEAVARLERQGAIAIDMETAAIAAVCERRACPWSVFRAISDRADDGSTDPAVLGLVGPDGRPKLAAVARYVLVHPWRALRLRTLARGTRAATHAAAAATVAALERLSADAPP